MKPENKKSAEPRYPDISEVASSNECTGMIPTPPLDEAEYESYQQLYSMEIPQKGEKSV